MMHKPMHPFGSLPNCLGDVSADVCVFIASTHALVTEGWTLHLTLCTVERWVHRCTRYGHVLYINIIVIVTVNFNSLPEKCWRVANVITYSR